MCTFQKLIIGESPYPKNKHYEPFTISLEELNNEFPSYIKVINNSSRNQNEELVIAFVPKLLVKKDLEKIVSFRRVMCMIYGPDEAKRYINNLQRRVNRIKNDDAKKEDKLIAISKSIAKKLHDDGIVLLNVLKAAPVKDKDKKNVYFKSVCDYCNKHEEARVLILGRIAVDECNKKIKKRRRNVLRYYHPSGRVNNEEKWKGIDYNNKAKLNTIEEVKGFSNRNQNS